MTQPSIKGTAFVSAVTDLQALIESGKLSRAQLERRLQPQDLAIVDAKILPGEWYPIESYGRILDAMGEAAGGGEAYHVQRGRTTAERLLRSGIYRQLDRAVEQRSEKDKASLIALMLTVGRTLYNFGAWEMLRDQSNDRRIRFELRQMAALPENARITIQGFVEWAGQHILGGKVRAESRRTHPDRILFDILLD